MLMSAHRLGWIFHASRFRIASENLPKSSENIVFMLGTIAFVANVITYGVHVKDKSDNVSLDHHATFIDIWDSFDKNATNRIFVHPSNFSLLNLIIFDASFQSNEEVAIVFDLSFLIVVDCLKLMSFAPHATFKLK